MARTRSPFASEVETLRGEIKGHQKELSRVDRELAGHYGAIAHAAGRREYLQELIQAKERTIARYVALAGARPGPRRARRPGRPPKAARPARRARRGRMGRAPTPASVQVTSDRFAALPVADAAEQVLKTAGKPVHLWEIVTQIIAGGKTIRAKKPHISILNVIARDKRFRNIGKNTWALA